NRYHLPGREGGGQKCCGRLRCKRFADSPNIVDKPATRLGNSPEITSACRTGSAKALCPFRIRRSAAGHPCGEPAPRLKCPPGRRSAVSSWRKKDSDLGECALCPAPATTEDHMPPKGIFA